MIFYIADPHFGHAGVIKFDNRPFRTSDAMDAEMIKRWNAKVTDNDTVYLLGDVWVQSGRNPDWYLSQLKGRKCLIIGNHDTKLLKNRKAMKYFDSYHTIQTVRDAGKKIVLCHYPLAEWEGYYDKAWHIYGHIHSNKKSPGYKVMCNEERALNAGCMINDYEPVTFDELLENNRKFYGWAVPNKEPKQERQIFFTF